MAYGNPYPPLKSCSCCGGEAKMKQTGRDKLCIQCKRCALKLEQRCLRYSLEWLEQRMAERWNQRTPPGGMALVPCTITAVTGHKAGMMGDFKESVEVMCSECDSDDPDAECGECGGLFFYRQEVPVSWTTIKAIHKRIVEIAEGQP